MKFFDMFKGISKETIVNKKTFRGWVALIVLVMVFLGVKLVGPIIVANNNLKLTSLTLDGKVIEVEEGKYNYNIVFDKPVDMNNLFLFTDEENKIDLIGENTITTEGEYKIVLINKYGKKVSYVLDIEVNISTFTCPFPLTNNPKDINEEEYCTRNVVINGVDHLVEARFTGKYGDGDINEGSEVNLIFNDKIILTYYEISDAINVFSYTGLKDALFLFTSSTIDFKPQYIIGVLPETGVFMKKEYIDKNIPSMHVSVNDGGVSITEEDIIFSASRLGTEFSVLGTERDTACYFTGTMVKKDTCETRVNNNLKICDVAGTTIVKAMYQFKYYGNGKISEITMRDSTTAFMEITKQLGDDNNVCP